MAQILNFGQQLAQAQNPPPPGLPVAPAAAPQSPVASSLVPPAPPPAVQAQLPVQGPPQGIAVGPGMPQFALSNGGMGASAPDPTRSGLSNMFGGGQQAATMEHAVNLDKLAASPGPLDYMVNFVRGNAQGKAKLDEQANNAAIFKQPDIQNYLATNPTAAAAAVKDPTGTASALHGALTAAMANQASMHTYAASTGNFSKTPEDAPGLAAKSYIMGEDPKNVLPFHEPHQFSDQEFIDATQGLNWKQASRIMAGYHYQTPQQQLIPQYLGGLQAEENAAKAAYDAAVTSGAKPAQLKTLQDTYTSARTANAGARAKLVEGQQAVIPNSAVQ